MRIASTILAVFFVFVVTALPVFSSTQTQRIGSTGKSTVVEQTIQRVTSNEMSIALPAKWHVRKTDTGVIAHEKDSPESAAMQIDYTRAEALDPSDSEKMEKLFIVADKMAAGGKIRTRKMDKDSASVYIEWDQHVENMDLRAGVVLKAEWSGCLIVMLTASPKDYERIGGLNFVKESAKEVTLLSAAGAKPKTETK